MSNENLTAARLAECWVEMTRLNDQCPDDLFEDGFQLNEIAYDAPEKAWAAIQLIIESMDLKSLSESGDPGAQSLAANLGAGPLETLIAQHGEELIEEIEARASSDARMAWVLGCVWQNAISDEIWERIQKAAGKASR